MENIIDIELMQLKYQQPPKVFNKVSLCAKLPLFVISSLTLLIVLLALFVIAFMS